MIICVGEILADLIGREDNGTFAYERYAGGAPFNVACGLRKLNADSGFCGSVGRDVAGDFLADFAARQGFGYLCIERSETRNTTLAFVELARDGERRFSFFRKNTADYALPDNRIDEIVRAADIVHLGSLMLSERIGRAFADRLIETTKAAGKRLSFDVNYRDDLFPDTQTAVETFARYIAAADIVKFSAEELDLFAPGGSLETKMQRIAEDKTVFVTLGGKGSAVCAAGAVCFEPSAAVVPIDTTGAGDAFLAGVLSALDEDERDPSKILRRGNVCGALTVQQRGAYPLWDRAAVERIVHSIEE